MPTFTMTLESVIEATGGRLITANGRTKLVGGSIGLEYYPLMDEKHRETLNGLIVDRYRVREIGCETIDEFQLFMRRRMNEIMPYYNKLYATELLKIDPLSTVNLRTVSNMEATQESNSEAERESNSQGDTTQNVDESTKVKEGNVTKAKTTAGSVSASGSRTVASEFPQVQLSDNGDYATNAADANSSSKTDSVSNNEGTSDSESDRLSNAITNGSSTGTERGTEKGKDVSKGNQEGFSATTGFQGRQAELLVAWRQTFMNIDVMIVDALDDLFMMIWDTDDSYSNYEGLAY